MKSTTSRTKKVGRFIPLGFALRKSRVDVYVTGGRVPLEGKDLHAVVSHGGDRLTQSDRVGICLGWLLREQLIDVPIALAIRSKLKKSKNRNTP